MPWGEVSRAFCVVVLGMLASSLPLAAHELELTAARLELGEGGRYRLELTCDLDALALGAAPSTDSAGLAAALMAHSEPELAERVDALRELLRRRVRLRIDGQRVDFEVRFPGYDALTGPRLREELGEPTVLGLLAELSGAVPEGAEHLTLRLSRAFPPLHLTVAWPGQRQGTPILAELGAESEPIPLAPPPPSSFWAVFGPYLKLGFHHILPAGLDHVLFVLGLFLISVRIRSLLWQVTAFTLAHTTTLALVTVPGLSGLAAWAPPARLVEIAIALSIVWVAVENVATREAKPWRPALVFAFGLLHGLGFAGVLGELGVPRDGWLGALLGFNVGVELGQLAVLTLAFAFLGPFRRRPGYRGYVTVPLSVVIAIIGLFWVVERLLGG